VTLAEYMETFLGSHDIEANSKETYARHLSLHVVPYIGKQRVAEVSRETIHRLLTVVLKEEGASQVIFPVRLFASTEAAGRAWLTEDEIDALGFTDELPNGRRYKHGTLGGYVTAQCRCAGCKQWSADYARDRKRRRTGRTAREWSPAWRSDPTEYLGADVWRRIWNTAVDEARLPFRYTPYQVRHTRRGSSTRVSISRGCSTDSATATFRRPRAREDPRRGRPQGRRSHVGDARRRCLESELGRT
jgi:hypothetical protein